MIAPKPSRFTRTHFLTLALILIFSFLRLYRIESSLLFFGDLGRDFLILEEWLETGKPPLLGPQTSALPFNQSAFYFYLLMPFYLITGKSLFATIIACVVIHILIFLWGVIVLRPHPVLRKQLFLIAFLVSIHPQFILQHRYVWNPSFVALSLLVAYFAYRLLQHKFTKARLVCFALGLASAVSFSYSALPAALVLFMIALSSLKKHRLPLIIGILAALFILNLPTIAFEFRHQFLLTHMMLNREKLPQSDSDPLSKIYNLARYTTSSDWLVNLLLVGSVALLTLLSYLKTRTQTLDRSLILFLATLMLTILSPFSLHAHYIFGVLIFFYIFITSLTPRYTLILVVLLSVFYLYQGTQRNYFRPAYRSAADSLACADLVCRHQTDPVHVAVQSGHHPYHDAKDFQYLFKRAGCDIRDLVIEPEQANHMLLVSDDSTYKHGQTQFHELTLFGPSTEIDTISCLPNLQIHLLEKI